MPNARQRNKTDRQIDRVREKVETGQVSAAGSDRAMNSEFFAMAMKVKSDARSYSKDGL